MSAVKFTPGPLDVCVWPDVDPVEQFREHLSHGSGRVWGVWAPTHPLTVGEHPQPAHAVMPAITGNGPSSEANAYLFAAAPDLYAALKALLKSAVHEAQQGDGVSEEMHPHILAADAALSKARGES